MAITALSGSNSEREHLETTLTAMESQDPRILLSMMGLPEADVSPELLIRLTEITSQPGWRERIEQLRTKLEGLPQQAQNNMWPSLRRNLEAAALVEAEVVPGVRPPFLKFHPTLAPILWARLELAEQEVLSLAHHSRYQKLAIFLYEQDAKNPGQVRVIARRELPNLLHAVHRAFDAGDPNAVQFAGAIQRFLEVFGMTRETLSLSLRAEHMCNERGTRAWILAQQVRGEQLTATGQISEALKVFNGLLDVLGEVPSYSRACTLVALSRCYTQLGQTSLSEDLCGQACVVTQSLTQSDRVKHIRGIALSELANAMAISGRFVEARKNYEQSLEISRELKDERGIGADLGKLAELAQREGRFSEAVSGYREALTLSRRLGEPRAEASANHQLGVAFFEMGQWEQAEHHYREAAQIFENIGDVYNSARTWNQLAILNETVGRSEAAETWYRKAVAATHNPFDRYRRLHNFADFLYKFPARLTEAREMAEEALALANTLNPDSSQIWRTYWTLAQIAELQSNPEQAASYRRQSRAAKRNYPGTPHEMKQFWPLISGTQQAVQDPTFAEEFDKLLLQLENRGLAKLVSTLRRIFAGERNVDSLCELLDYNDSMIVETILRAIEDPAILEMLRPEAEESEI